MSSSKDRYESGRWLAGRFAAGKWRGIGVAAANPAIVTKRLTIVGTSMLRMAVEGTSMERMTVSGTSGERLTIEGSSR
jgi:hypothetical protein